MGSVECGLKHPLAPSGGRKPYCVLGVVHAASRATSRPYPACEPSFWPAHLAVQTPGPRPRVSPPSSQSTRRRSPSPRSAGPCPPQRFSIGSACAPISRRLSPGDGGRGCLHRPRERQRSPASVRVLGRGLPGLRRRHCSGRARTGEEWGDGSYGLWGQRSPR